MAAQPITQVKGEVTFVWGTLSAINLTKDASIAYDIGANGETYGSLKDVVHVIESSGSIISTITITLPKGAPEIGAIDTLVATQTPYPILVRDDGVGYTVGMVSAICTQVSLTETTGDNTLESVSYAFKGNLVKTEL